MSKPKHTPGPWGVSDNYIVCDKGEIAELNWDRDAEIDFVPNAQLIAAAPEMLEALYWALHHITETHGIKQDELSPILDIIAKAEGSKVSDTQKVGKKRDR